MGPEQNAVNRETHERLMRSARGARKVGWHSLAEKLERRAQDMLNHSSRMQLVIEVTPVYHYDPS